MVLKPRLVEKLLEIGLVQLDRYLDKLTLPSPKAVKARQDFDPRGDQARAKEAALARAKAVDAARKEFEAAAKPEQKVKIIRGKILEKSKGEVSSQGGKPPA
ncbi:unnamed protein product [marine sediment metagenome]|uniref:Uncharacterized protein n=1 Tax=marine sediment metagenome TaxID=412755 RepID=X1JDS6_9ZZZZ